jgi:glucose/arabinose dehydrogenase
VPAFSVPLSPARDRLRLALTSLALAGLVAGGHPGISGAQDTGSVIDSEKHSFRLATLVQGLEHPWGLAFLPDGSMLVTERPGRLRLIKDGVLQAAPIEGVPEVAASGQGGLLDVALHPDFAENRLLYLSYASDGWISSGTEIARARLADGRLEELEVILAVEPKSGGGRHFGSRLLFGPDGLLYATLGERGDDERAQDPGDLAGTVVRVTPDGAVPPDNPFVNSPGTEPEIFTLGHRNPQGLALQPSTGRIWAIEHGPLGGDELNLLVAGANYGWPVITYGKSYAGAPIGEGSEKPGMMQPATYWVPSISPSGLAFYDGAAFPAWQGNLFLGALSGQCLVRLEIEGERVVREERLLTELGERIRDVRVGPDGLLYLLTDHPDGALLRLEPAS